MAKKDVGVFQMENGFWAYRFKMVVEGKEISRRKSTDEHGNKLNNKTEAIKAREAAILAARTERQRQRKISRRTIKEVFEEYREKGCSGKAYKSSLFGSSRLVKVQEKYKPEEKKKKEQDFSHSFKNP